MPRRKRRFWTASQLALLRRLYPSTPTKKLARQIKRSVLHIFAKAASLGLKKTPEYLASPAACRLRRGDHVGKAYCFPKGHVPANKGLRRPGWSVGRMKETQFKKGQISKRWDPEVFIVGALRINSDGGLDIKLHYGPRSWYSMARWTWQTERGPIPKNHVVRFKNSDNHDTRIENLRLGTSREVMLENTLHNYPKPIVAAIQLRGALIRQINRREEQRGKDA